ncbi:MAG: formylmethanofuran dehydrogenase subunit B [Candidatus Syntropharchaeia archaeon]
MGEVIESVVCPFCACLCDDIDIKIEGEEITINNACSLGRSKILSFRKKRLKTPLVRNKNGLKEVDFERAFDEAVKILKNAKKPIIYGLGTTGYDAGAIALEIARKKRGIIDTTESICHNPFFLHLREKNFFFSTLEEIRDKATLVIFWGCDPVHSHPRFLSRYAVYPRGKFIEKGVEDREVVVIDVKKKEIMKNARQAIILPPETDHIAMQILKKFLTSDTSGIRKLMENSGIDEELNKELQKLSVRMKDTLFGVIFFGLGLTSTKSAEENMKELFILLEELNRHTKFVSLPMLGHFNISGITHLLLRETGYPFGIDFSDGVRFEPGRTTILDGIHDVDAGLIIGADPASTLPRSAVKRMSEIPLILLDPFLTPTALISDVVFPVAICGIETDDIAYRMDGIPLRMKGFLKPPENIRSDKEILKRLFDAI